MRETHECTIQFNLFSIITKQFTNLAAEPDQVQVPFMPVLGRAYVLSQEAPVRVSQSKREKQE